VAGQVEVDVPREREAPGMVRTLLRDRLADDLGPVELAEAQMVVSELVSNAVLHGEGAIRLRLTLDEDALHGEVVDEGTGFEADLRERGVEEAGGRGLWLVASLSRRWGIHDGSSHVWFELRRRAREHETTSPELGEEHRPDELD
jgi:anti-sigma regulatory factor (Ser/Thr protein kinase)